MSVGLRSCLSLLLLAWATVLAAQAPSLPRDDGYQHLGVASCSSAGCHGDQVYGAGAGPVVGQNEVLIWKSVGMAGAHSRAYALLNSELGQRIARNLGMTDAREEAACLDCHANNVPPEQRGRRFQLSDGVSCEACHGGAENWLAYHRLGAGHAKNIERGLYPTADPVARATLCASCHQGREENAQFVSHELMGAGHPQLHFELQRYTNWQAHHQIDADYRERKPVPPAAQVWALGQILSAQRQLSLVGSDRATGLNSFPEFSLYDCQACHQPLGEGLQGLDWSPHPLRQQPSGAPVLQDAALLMLRSLVRVQSPQTVREFDALLQQWHAQPGLPGQPAEARQALLAKLQTLQVHTLQQPPAPAALLQVLLEPRFITLLHEWSAGQQWLHAVEVLLPLLSPDVPEIAADTLAKLQARLQSASGYSASRLVAESGPLRRWLAQQQDGRP